MIGTKLRELRKAKGRTQQEAANLADVGYRTYQSYEENRAMPPLTVLFRLSDIYKLTIEEMCRSEKTIPENGPEVIWRHYVTASPELQRAVDKLLDISST